MSALVFVYPCSLVSHEDGYWVEVYWEPCTWIYMDGVCCHKDGITAIPILYFSPHYLCAAVNFCVNLGKKNPPNQVARVEHLISSFLPLIVVTSLLTDHYLLSRKPWAHGHGDLSIVPFAQAMSTTGAAVHSWSPVPSPSLTGRWIFKVQQPCYNAGSLCRCPNGMNT